MNKISLNKIILNNNKEQIVLVNKFKKDQNNIKQHSNNKSKLLILLKIGKFTIWIIQIKMMLIVLVNLFDCKILSNNLLN